MFKVMWQVSTNQSALFDSSFDTLLFAHKIYSWLDWIALISGYSTKE